MKTQRMLTGVMALAIALLGQAAPAASPVIDDVNDGRVPGNFVFDSSIANVGWQYTPLSAYLLDGVTSTFRSISSPPVTTRDVTLSVYDAPPSSGGSVLRTGTFSAGQAGGDLGVMFEPLQLEAGENYFIAYENVAGLGLNIVDFAVSLPPPQPANPPFNRNPDVDFLDGWYTGAGFATFLTLEDSPGFASPILRLHGVVPEPSSAALAAFGLLTISRLRRGRRTLANKAA